MIKFIQFFKLGLSMFKLPVVISTDNFTVCSQHLTWPSNGSEAGGDLALTQTTVCYCHVNAPS